LLSHTSRIRYEEQDVSDPLLPPGCSTREAVEHGCRLMLQGFVLEQMRRAEGLLGEGYAVLVTGGDAGLLDGVLPRGSHVRDLVFEGLAMACPMSVEEGCV
jgi:type III pantothenate kinase